MSRRWIKSCIFLNPSHAESAVSEALRDYQYDWPVCQEFSFLQAASLLETGNPCLLVAHLSSRLEAEEAVEWCRNWRQLQHPPFILITCEASLISNDLFEAADDFLLLPSDGSTAYLRLMCSARHAAASGPAPFSKRLLLETLCMGVADQTGGIAYLAHPDAAPSCFFSHIAGKKAEAMGLSAASWKSNPSLCRQLLHPDDRDTFESPPAWDIPQTREYRLLAPNRSTHWFQDHAFPLPAEGADPAYIFGIMLDVTGLKASEEHSQILNSAIRDIGEAVFIMDARLAWPDSPIVFTNTALAGLLACREEALLGRPAKSLFARPELLVENFAACKRLEEGQVCTFTESCLRKDGSSFQAKIQISPVCSAGNQISHYVALVSDITSDVVREEERIRASKVEAIGQLAGGIAHDFNNLLMTIGGNLSIIRSTLNKKHPCYGTMEDAQEAVHRASELARQLLTFARGGEPIKRASSINELLQKTATFDVHGSKCRLEFNLLPDAFNVEIDNAQISQVIDNLMINAIQAMPSGGKIFIRTQNMLVSDEIPLPPLAPGPYVRIEIQDEGSGIPLEIQDKIFEPYFTTKSGGSGLGLATAYSIVKRHGGILTVESGPKRGSSFSLYLPASNQKPDFIQRRKTTRMPRWSGRVLVMDDEAPVRKTMTRMFTGMGFNVTQAENGEEALQAFLESRAQQQPFCLVTLDLTVPGGKGGEDVISEIRKVDPNLPVVACSGYFNDPVMADFHSYGFSAALTKPFKIRELGDLLQQLLQGHASPEHGFLPGNLLDKGASYLRNAFFKS